MTNMIETHPAPEFEAWDHVRKTTGYVFAGTVLSAFQQRDGQWRMVVENDQHNGGLHIVRPDQVEKVHD